MTVWPNGSTQIPRVTDEFGPRPGRPVPGVSPFHRGIDLVGFALNRSPCNGTVIFAAYNGTAGNHISIRGDNGDVFDIFHNASFLVGRGQRVSEGQAVGVQGTTGASTGVHCHFECHPGGGAAVNPRVYMAAAIANNGGSASAGGGPAPAPITNSEDEEDEMLFIRSKGKGAAGFARDGYIYRRVEGSWMAVQNLEGEVLVPALVAKGALLADFAAQDLEIMFATDGIWEQSIIPGGNVWGTGRIPLQGLGYRTGRRIFPGAPGALGQWHFPAQLK